MQERGGICQETDARARTFVQKAGSAVSDLQRILAIASAICLLIAGVFIIKAATAAQHALHVDPHAILSTGPTSGAFTSCVAANGQTGIVVGNVCAPDSP